MKLDYSTRRIQIFRVYFCWGHFSLVFKNRTPKNDHRKTYPEDLDSPRRELFIRGLGFIAALLVRWQINVLSTRIGHPTDLKGLERLKTN